MNKGGNNSERPAAALLRELLSRSDPAQAAHLRRFFKTGPGQYGEGDRFIGLKVPVTRSLIKPYRAAFDREDFVVLLDSEWHEARLAALLLLGDRAARLAREGDAAGLDAVAALYDEKLDRANNWDLIDLSVNEIMGPFWTARKTPAREIMRQMETWADSGVLWRERAAMVSTLSRQRAGSLEETFRLAERFIPHRHDLMHKACGWMLREAGKRDLEALRSFLAVFHQKLPRTALRYAIERMDAAERKKWMAR